MSRAHDVPLLIVANLEAVCLGLPDKCRDMMDLLTFDILIIENYYQRLLQSFRESGQVVRSEKLVISI